MNKTHLKTATTVALLAFFNANTGGEPVKKFKDRKTAEARVGKLMDEMIADGDMEDTAEAPSQPTKKPAVASEIKTDVPTKVKAEKAPKAPKGIKSLTATALALSPEMTIRADSFRGQILATIVAEPGISKAVVIAKHKKYTHDVICKFKRLGLIIEMQKDLT